MNTPSYSYTNGSGVLTTSQPRVVSARSIIAHADELSRSIATLPVSPALAHSIENVRQDMDTWMERMSDDARIILESVRVSKPHLLEAAQKRISDALAEFHRKARELLLAATSRCCDVSASVDAPRLKKDLEQYFGVSRNDLKEVETEILPLTNTISFDPIVVTHEPENNDYVASLSFIEHMTDGDTQRLLLDIVRIDEENVRNEMIGRLVDSITARAPLTFRDEDKNRIIGKLQDFADALRRNQHPNPYHLKVSNHALLGVLPETPNVSNENPMQSFQQWRDRRPPSDLPDRNGDGIPEYTCGSDRKAMLNGSMIFYRGTGEVDELVIDGDGESRDTIARMLEHAQGKPERAVGVYFVDKHELEETLLSLPADGKAVLHIQLKNTDIECRIVRNAAGFLQITDANGQRPAPLRNKDISDEEIIHNPLAYFSARNMRLEIL
jgi:hypothetical protein